MDIAAGVDESKGDDVCLDDVDAVLPRAATPPLPSSAAVPASPDAEPQEARDVGSPSDVNARTPEMPHSPLTTPPPGPGDAPSPPPTSPEPVSPHALVPLKKAPSTLPPAFSSSDAEPFALDTDESCNGMHPQDRSDSVYVRPDDPLPPPQVCELSLSLSLLSVFWVQ